MKQLFPLLCITLVLCCILAFVACDGNMEQDNTGFKLSFVVDGQVISTISTDGASIEGSIPDVPQKDGYAFDWWYWDENVWEKPLSVDTVKEMETTDAMSLYAKFTPTEYTVTYNNTKGAENRNPATYTVESGIIRLTPLAKEDYIFDGWTDETGAAISAIATADVKNRTLTAKWTPCVDHVVENCHCTLCGKTVHTLDDRCICTVCGEACHSVDGHCQCTNCGKTVHGIKDGGYCRHGDTVYLGSYPQTDVTDSMVASVLNEMAGTLPTAENPHNWTDYGYYRGDDNWEPVQTSYMWYIDLSYEGKQYRGVYFNDYRLSSTTSKSANILDIYQHNNGYDTGNVYWFAFEPIKWRILTTDDDDVALLLCDMAIDCQNVYLKGENQGYITTLSNGKKIYQNNYEYSTIRTWLNETFYNAAFGEQQKSVIQLTTVDNSVRSVNPNNEPNKWDDRRVCANTQDYVYLPSMQELTTVEYGFNASIQNNDEARQKGSTDYAKSQGIYYECSWWMRSPNWSNTCNNMIVSMDGTCYRYRDVDSTSTGVVPVVRIKL